MPISVLRWCCVAVYTDKITYYYQSLAGFATVTRYLDHVPPPTIRGQSKRNRITFFRSIRHIV